MNPNGKNIVEALTNSKLFLDYHRAYGDMTGLPLALRPLESWQLPYHGRQNENAYCAINLAALHRKASPRMVGRAGLWTISNRRAILQDTPTYPRNCH